MPKTIIYCKNAPEPIGPYSQAVRSGDMLFVSGQVAIDPSNGKMQDTDITSEANQVMKNLQSILLEAGYSFADVVKSTIFLKDLNDFNTVNGIYGTYFTENPPARETVEVARLPRNARVEISVIAVKTT